MRKALLYLFLIVAASGFQDNKTNVKKWVVTSGCSLKVDGSTNVNNFSCIIAEYSNPDTIIATINSSQSVGLSGNIKLDIQKFNCHNPVMTSDLRKTLKAKEFPKLMIRFISLSQYPDIAARNTFTKGIVMIELAGITKRFDVNYKIVSVTNNFINMIGTRQVNFSDFKITPPSRLGGMIRTNNEINVVFDLKLKVFE
ncbi:YceI family protein [Chitinophagaceae bacterium LB-8]|uniref:YceI family protein n=1 Tax=Paraflavisolibacter caeni TaxID=2982496 RepID=A0A9X2XPW7_9BACT|nr:YceI family protein [Paraflavisolibacter caeni]MCU7552373.1 YceI family protein [Paraflavisolibacter caeni]